MKQYTMCRLYLKQETKCSLNSVFVVGKEPLLGTNNKAIIINIIIIIIIISIVIIIIKVYIKIKIKNVRLGSLTDC